MIKKTLLIVLAVIVVAVASFFLIGLLSPTYAYETRVTIDKPRDDVWRIFNDESKMGQWLVGFKSIETISGERNGIGSKYRIRMSQDGRDFEMIEEMKEFRAPELFAFRLDSDVFSDDVRIVLNDVGGKTEIVQSDRVTGANLFCRSLLFWMRSHLREGARTNLENLKKLAESSK